MAEETHAFSTNAADDATIASSTLVSWGTGTGGARVHSGYRAAYLSVKPFIFTTLSEGIAVAAYANYTLVTTGHDIGGPLAVFAGSDIRSTFLNK